MIGAYTTAEAPGALPNGTRIVKVRSEPGDAHQVGDLGTVIGSIAVSDAINAQVIAETGRRVVRETHAYFIEWDNMPLVAIGVVGSKIEQYRGEP